MYKIYINGNTFYIQDTSNGDKLYEGHAKNVLLRRVNLTSTLINFNNVNNSAVITTAALVWFGSLID